MNPLDDLYWVDRFWSYVAKSDECWEWTGSMFGNGYGRLSIGGRGGREYTAHRLSYALASGSIPDGLVIDHLCYNTICVRPDHLEPVTQYVNVQRSRHKNVALKRSQECKHGHSMAEPSEYYMRANGTRRCKRCSDDLSRQAHARRLQRMKGEVVAHGT